MATQPTPPAQDPPVSSRSVSRASQPGGAWSDGMGRVASRAAQTLLVAAVAVGVLWLLLRIKVVVVAVLVALVLGAAVSPAVRWLVGKGWSHLLATIAAFVGILTVVGGVVGGVVLAIRNEWETLQSSAVDGWQQLQDWLRTGPLPVDTTAVDDLAQQVVGAVISGDVAGMASSTLTGLSAATEFFAGVILMVVVLFFFLKDGPKIANFTLRWFQGDTRAKLAESADRSAEVLGGYVRGTAIVAAVDAVLIGIGLAIVGVPLALPLAVIVFVGAFIPIVGATVAGVLAALVALVTTGPVEALIVLAIVIIVNQVEGDLLQPVIMGQALSLHPLVVLLALTIGTIVGGIFGAILAVPYTAVGWTIIQLWTDRYQSGEDPVLGDDPLDPRSHARARASGAQRWRYQLMRGQSTAPSDEAADTEQGQDGRGTTSAGAPDGHVTAGPAGPPPAPPEDGAPRP